MTGHPTHDVNVRLYGKAGYPSKEGYLTYWGPSPPCKQALSNNNGDGNENVEKAIREHKENNNFALASRFFVLCFAVTARLRRENA